MKTSIHTKIYAVMSSESISHPVVSNSLWPPWTVAHQAPLSIKFSREVYWSGLPFPSPGDLPESGTKPGTPVLQADSSQSEVLLKSYKKPDTS